MNLKQLRYVLVLSQEGSFSRAAETLNITQPSLSQYIKKIEREIGMPLFDRSGGDVRLTDAGWVYIEAGRKILDIEHQMNAQFSDIAAYKTGSITVGTSPFRSASMMPVIAKRFQSIYPGIHLVVEEHVTADLLDGLEHGEFDFCLTMLPVDERLFAYEKICEEELVLAVPVSYPKLPAIPAPERRYAAIDAKQLAGMSFIMITETQVMQRTLDNLCSDYKLNIHKAAVVKSLEAQIAMVRAGVGVALVPTGIENFCAEGEVVFFSFAQELPKREIVAMWRKEQKPSLIAHELINVMKGLAW